MSKQVVQQEQQQLQEQDDEQLASDLSSYDGDVSGTDLCSVHCHDCHDANKTI